MLVSRDGEAARSEGALCEGFRFGHGSGDVGPVGGVRAGELLLASDIESAWKNLLAACDLPTAERGGEGA